MLGIAARVLMYLLLIHTLLRVVVVDLVQEVVFGGRRNSGGMQWETKKLRNARKLVRVMVHLTTAKVE